MRRDAAKKLPNFYKIEVFLVSFREYFVNLLINISEIFSGIGSKDFGM